MKITQQLPEPPPFKPVTIILETQDEVDQLCAILDTGFTSVCPILNCMPEFRRAVNDKTSNKYYQELVKLQKLV